MVIFEAVSKLNKRIRLTEIQWAHIELKHKDEGFIISAFFVAKIRKERKEVIYGEDIDKL